MTPATPGAQLKLPDLSGLAGLHGPYEDLGLASLRILEDVIKDAPQPVKQQFWNAWLEWHSGLMKIGAKLDPLHLFHPAPDEPQ